MKTLRLILGDQLSHTISSLDDINKANDVVLMCEVIEEATYVKHHKKKIAFIFSAMRHFADELINSGYKVVYVKLDDPVNVGTFSGEIERAIDSHNIDKIVVTYPGEYRVLQEILSWEIRYSVLIDVRPDTRFLSTLEEFYDWAKDRKQMRMEYFYREMRKKYLILMDEDKPLGGKWNYDSENRKFPKGRIDIPKSYESEPDEITLDVMAMVNDKFKDHFGNLEPFNFAVTRDQALVALSKFVDQRLHDFGDYQDAMIEDEPWMYHSHISFYLNNGLLLPKECIEAAEKAYYDGKAPINSVEGFIRQIIGWREYVRGIYWLKMPEYSSLNFFNASRDLPEFYWTGETEMNCLKQCVSETKQNAYAHHIQRLMVLGNFALISGIAPSQVNEWFLTVYADAYEWVELPNVSGMILFSDGGYLASKPYAAGGSYINKMSDYCDSCTYSVKKKSGPEACPFNYLYWDFLARNRNKLSGNPRASMMYRTYDRMTDDKKDAISYDSDKFLNSLIVGNYGD